MAELKGWDAIYAAARRPSDFQIGWTDAQRDHADGGAGLMVERDDDYTRGYLAGWADAARDRTPEVPGCDVCKRVADAGFGPSHRGHACCRMGRALAAGGDVAHCTCAGCF